MNIRIKELFKSDLDPNSNEWWSKDKIDKINFNFSLLRNGGPIGPAGLEGPNGIDGDKGETGVEGPQGPYGDQGPVGPPSEGVWKSYTSPEGKTAIYPAMPLGIDGISVPVIGASAHKDSNGDLLSAYYGNTASSPINAAGSGALNIISESPSSNHLYNARSIQSSIQLTLDADKSKSFNIGLFSLNNVPTFQIYPTIEAIGNYTNVIKLNRDLKLKFLPNTPALDYTLGENSITDFPFNVNAQAPEEIKFTVNNVKYVGGSINNVFKSNSSDGQMSWENVATMFSILPIGSIVRIPSTSFNSNNFILEDANTESYGIIPGQGGTHDIRTNFGAGKTTGMFAGWYLCNGLKWGDGAAIAYDTPNLNGFSYSFENLSSTQYGNIPLTTGGDSHSGRIVYAGANSSMSNTSSMGSIDLSGSNNSEDNYVWNSQIDSEDENHIVFGEQVSIIYLGGYDYLWSNYDPNITTSAVQLSYHEIVGDLDQDGVDISMQYSATLAPENLEWTASGVGSTSTDIDQYWANNTNFNNGGVSTGIRCYQSGAELSTGWLWRNDLCRYYINGTGFSGDAVTVQPRQLWTWYEEAVNDIDGTQSVFPSVTASDPLSSIPLSDITNNNSLNLIEVYTSNRVENSPMLLTTFNWEDYEHTSHIWTVNSSNEIVKPATGWYRSIPYSSSWTIPLIGGLFGGSNITYAAGYRLKWRKYWDNSTNSFKGDHLRDDFTPWSIDKFTLTSGASSSTACSSTTGYDIFFNSTGNSSGYQQDIEVTNIDSTSYLDGGIEWSNNAIYVRENSSPQSGPSSSSNKGKYPLRKIKQDTFIPGTGVNLLIKQINGSHYREINSSSIASSGAISCIAYIPPTASIITPEFSFIEAGTSEQVSAFTANFQAGATLTYSWSVDKPWKFILTNPTSETVTINFVGNASDSADLSLTVTGPDMNGNIQTLPGPNDDPIELEIWGEPYD